MARLAAIERALYYPTPLSVIPLIRKHLQISGSYAGSGQILDPCCGEGEAVRELGRCLGPEWVATGIEIEGERAAAAARLLGEERVYHAALEQVSLADDGNKFDLVFLNPPYDCVAGQRVEPRFVEMAGGFLAERGLMILIVPESLVGDGKYAGQLRRAMNRARLYHAVVLRFPEPEYEPFSQVVVLAARGHSHYTLDAGDLEVLGTLGDIPDRVEGQRLPWELEQQVWRKSVSLSRYAPSIVSPLLNVQFEPPAASAFDPSLAYHILGDPTRSGAEMRPLMPMRDTHAAMIAAAGMLNGVQIEDKVIRSSSYKKQVQVERVGQSASGQEVKEVVQTEKLVVALTALDLSNGEITRLDNDAQPEEFEKLLLAHARQFVDVAHSMFPPVCNGDTLDRWRAKIDQVRAPRAIGGHQNGLFEPQKERVAAILEGWQSMKCVTLVGEMSTGKTVQSLAAAAIAAQRRRPGNRHILIVLPPRDDLLDKWEEEARRALRNFQNPDGSKGPKVFRLKTITDVQQAFQEQGLTVLLLKDTSAKLSSGWAKIPHKTRQQLVPEYMARYEPRELSEHQIARKVDGGWCVYKKVHVPVCPGCGKNPYRDEEEYPVGNPPACPFCGERLWQRVRQKNGSGPGIAKYPLARFIRDRYHARYILIVDECHRAKSGDSAIGYAFMDLVSSAWRMLQMTGTVFGGVASSLFYLLYRTVPAFRDLYSLKDVQKFVDVYGLWERITKFYPEYRGATFSGYKEFKGSPSEIPGVAPGMAALLLPSSAFITLEDLAFQMPDYSEHTLFVDAPTKLKGPIEGFLQAGVSEAIADAKNGDYGALGQYRMARLATWDVPDQPDAIGGVRRGPVAGSDTEIYPKEEALLRLVWQEGQAGRKVIVFVAQIHKRDCTGRLCRLLERYGMKGAVLRAEEKHRVPFIKRALAGGADVVFCSPDIVDVGIDLDMFQTAVWYGVHYSMYIVPQANRRLYRLTQTLPVRIVYLAYNETPQATAFHRVAKKMQAQQAIQGDIRNGLANLLGEADFVSRLQDLVAESKRVESDLSLDELPPLPAPGAARKAKPEPVASINLVPVKLAQVQVAQGVAQASFF